MGLQLSKELSSILLEDGRLVTSFVSWLAGECRVVSRKRNRLALGDSMRMKDGGASKSSITYFSKVTRCTYVPLISVLGLLFRRPRVIDIPGH